VYIFNDIHDVEQDRLHPLKCTRPVAAGVLSIRTAWILFAFFALAGLVSACLLDTSFFIIALCYFVMHIAYSLGLKHVSILDVFIIAIGFVLRVLAGAALIHVSVSMWIVIMTFLLALFLAFAKRRDDVLLSSDGMETRKCVKGYNLEFLNAGMVLMAGVVIVSYILYTMSEDVIRRFDSPYLYLTSVFVVLGILRYMQIAFIEENSGSPTKVVLQDTFLKITIFLWLLSFLLTTHFRTFI
jgi:4-hydroxybenzoate polyprenyltransferase